MVKGEQRILKQWMYEAFFCCTMRSSEGFYELSKSLIKEKDQYLLLIPQSFKNEDIDINIDLYEEKVFNVEFLKPGTIQIYVPDGFVSEYPIANNIITISSDQPKKIDIPFELSINKVNQLYLLGDMILSQKNNHKSKIFNICNQEYSLIYDSSKISEEEMTNVEQKL